jgi:hypothetical protein
LSIFSTNLVGNCLAVLTGFGPAACAGRQDGTGPGHLLFHRTDADGSQRYPGRSDPAGHFGRGGDIARCRQVFGHGVGDEPLGGIGVAGQEELADPRHQVVSDSLASPGLIPVVQDRVGSGSLQERARTFALLSPDSGPAPSAWLDALAAQDGSGIGLEEAAPALAGELSPEQVDGYLDDVLTAVRRFLAGPAIDLDAVPEVRGALIQAGIEPFDFGWLHRMWQDKPAAWLVRWPLTGHLLSPVGEMIATRNRMGLSPF